MSEDRKIDQLLSDACWSHFKHCRASISRRRVFALSVVFAAVFGGSSARATDVEDFYKGRAMPVIVGFGVGGGYDLFGRLLARHMPKYIPGVPKMIPQNMVGAGSLRAANYLYSVAPKDGSVIGTFARTLPLAPLLAKADYDSRRLTWLGSLSQDVTVCFAWHQSSIKTWNDFISVPSTFGGEGPGAEPDIYALLFKNIFGAKIKLVSGYHGTKDLFLALERQEIDGLCGISWGTIVSLYPTWLNERKINILVQAGLRTIPELGSTPSASILAVDPGQRQILKMIFTSLAMARPFAAPPGIPADRQAALVSAFEKMAVDPEFLKEAEKLNLNVELVRSTTIDALLAEAYATPSDDIRKTIDAISK
jgi:tripartite-type tricarboxylate transporter receptor subunit TctC